VSKGELDNRQWKYPIDTERCQTDRKEFDIGWADGKIKLNVMIVEL